MGAATGAAMSADQRYADREWGDSVPHPLFLSDVERAYPGHVLVYDDMGRSREWVLSFR